MRPHKSFDSKILFIIFIIFATIFYIIFSSKQENLKAVVTTADEKSSSVKKQLFDPNNTNDLPSIDILNSDYSLASSDKTEIGVEDKTEAEDKNNLINFLEPEIQVHNANDDIYEVKKDNSHNSISTENQQQVKSNQGASDKFDDDVKTGEETKEVAKPFPVDLANELSLSMPKLPPLPWQLPPLPVDAAPTTTAKTTAVPSLDNSKSALEAFILEKEDELKKQFETMHMQSREEHKNNPLFNILDGFLSEAENELMLNARKETKELLSKMEHKIQPPVQTDKAVDANTKSSSVEI